MCKKLKGIHNRIDPCMKNLINFLKKQVGFPTVACCCGHGIYPMTIVMNVRITILNKPKFVDIISGIEIPRKRNFYEKDKQGYYFIPEVI